jgi:hypothetical protein
MISEPEASGGQRMGCDEPVGNWVAHAILNVLAMGWVDSLGSTASATPAAPSQSTPSKRGKQAKARGTGGAPAPVTAADVRRLTTPPRPLLPAITRTTELALKARLEEVRATSSTAVGDLGEQVTVAVLEQFGYTIDATQADLKAAVPGILGPGHKEQPEDIIATTSDNRYTTVNSKATMSPNQCRILADGNLSAPPMSKGQNTEDYYTTRAGLLSPLDDGGVPFGQVMKVDLINLKAQLFDISPTGQLSPIDKPIDIMTDVAAIFSANPGTVYAPTGPNADPVER